MKSILDNLLRAVRRVLSPITRPLVRKLDAHINGLVNQALSDELEQRLVPTLSSTLETTSRTVDRLDALIDETSRASENTDAALGHLLDEVVRLRGQVELLQQIVQPENGELTHDSEAIVGLPFDADADSRTTFPSDAPDERARVG
jgi:hypothetical protein